jgi:hypothetical protein
MSTGQSSRVSGGRFGRGGSETGSLSPHSLLTLCLTKTNFNQHLLLNEMKTGRPRIDGSQKKAQIAGVRLRAEERELLEKAACKRELKLSEWMRKVLVSSAKTELRSKAPINAS